MIDINRGFAKTTIFDMAGFNLTIIDINLQETRELRLNEIIIIIYRVLGIKSNQF